MSTFAEIPFDKPTDGPEQQVDQSAFFITSTQSRITQNGKFIGLKQIQVTGKSIIEHNTSLRGDLAKIKIGYYVIVGEGSILKPAEKFANKLQFMDMTIGDYTVIGRNCVIRASKIGCCCWIGEGTVIGNKCAIEDCAMILDNSVLAPLTTVPPYTVFAGNPAKCVGRLPPTFDMLMNEHTHAFYGKFATIKGMNQLPGAAQRQAPASAHRATGGANDPRLARQHGTQRSSRPGGDRHRTSATSDAKPPSQSQTPQQPPPSQ